MIGFPAAGGEASWLPSIRDPAAPGQAHFPSPSARQSAIARPWEVENGAAPA